MARPRIILHIGRNKCGSTTIQEACFASRAQLADHGIRYGLFGHLWQSSPDVLGWMTFEALADQARSGLDTTWLVSNEFMSAWPSDFTRHAGCVLAGCDVSIVAYVRRYDHWICSAYAEETRAGMNSRDIDTYVRDMHPLISALPNLLPWAEAFGWDNLRVRSIHPADLAGGELLADFADAIGLATPFPTVLRQNVAPAWMELELIRRLTARDATEAWGGADPTVVLPLAELIRSLEPSPCDCQYLTADRQQELLDVYADDSVILKGRGQIVTPINEPALPRPFLPSFNYVPPTVRDRFFADARTTAFAAAHPAAAAAATRLAEPSRAIGSAFDRAAGVTPMAATSPRAPDTI